uniref:HTH CENPB-type domain-containing protein n=1 Tax=Acrobeloides nanus TaxID=290746 RepID=A0A914CDM8_9BILA
MIREWCEQEHDLQISKKGAKRLADGGRHLSFAELDDQLATWVREQRAGKKKVSRRMIQMQAQKNFVQDDNEQEFKVGKHRLVTEVYGSHNFVAREPTTVCQKPPKEYEHALVNLVMYISQLREKNNFQHIYAADETAVWLDSTGGKCIADKGAKEVSVLTTGHDKMRIFLVNISLAFVPLSMRSSLVNTAKVR